MSDASGRTGASRPSKFAAVEVTFPPSNDLRHLLVAGAEAQLNLLPERLARLRQVASECDPVGLLATFATYGLSRTVGKDGVGQSSPTGTEQHHAELLQALLLTMPANEWGSDPCRPEVMQELFELVPKLADAFLARQLSRDEDTSDRDDAARAVGHLQARMRLHTQAVRNWAHYSKMVAISKDLYGPLQGWAEHHGFEPGELVRVAESLVSFADEALTHRWTTLRQLQTARSPDRMADLFFRRVPELVSLKDDVRDLVAGLPFQARVAVFLNLLDRVTSTRLLVDPLGLSEAVDVAGERVQAVFDALALRPGALVGADTDRFFIGNPVWDRPLLRLGDAVMATTPQVVFSYMHEIVGRLAVEASGQAALAKRRSTYLERKVEELFAAALPGAILRSGLSWTSGGRRYETDLLVQLGRVLLIVEAKSHRLTASSLRGAPERMRRHVEDLIVAPSLQSARLEERVMTGATGDADALDVCRQISVEPEHVDRIIRLSITLDDFSILSASEQELRAANWIPDDHILAPAITVADLATIADILDRPALLLHYLSRRSMFQSAHQLTADEWDLIGYYLEMGFGHEAFPDDVHLVLTGASSELDRYYTSLDAGVRLPKPKAKLQPYVWQLLQSLETHASEWWLLASLQLLDALDPDSQRQLERAMNSSRKRIRRRKGTEPEGIAVTVLPDGGSSALTVLVVDSADDQQERAMSLTEKVLRTSGRSGCITIVRSSAHWSRPYEFMMSGCLSNDDVFLLRGVVHSGRTHAPANGDRNDRAVPLE